MHLRPIQRDADTEMTDFGHEGRIPEYLFHLTYTDSEIIYIYTYGGKYTLVGKVPICPWGCKELDTTEWLN